MPETFFFGNYEGLRQRQGVTNVATVPDANAHQGLILAPGGGLQQVAVAPSTRSYLDLWPLPNGPAIGSGIATLFAAANSSVDENFFVVRADHHFNDKQSLFARVTYDQGNLITPDAVLITATTAAAHTRYTTLQHDFIVSPQFLMTTRIAYNRTLLLGNEIPLINYPPSLNLFVPGWLPQLGFPGVTVMGPGGRPFFQ